MATITHKHQQQQYPHTKMRNESNRSSTNYNQTIESEETPVSQIIKSPRDLLFKEEYFPTGLMPHVKSTYSHEKHKKIVESLILAESPSCSRLRKQLYLSPRSQSNENGAEQEYHRSRVYSNYKYPSVERDFNHELLNNSCDSIKNLLAPRLRNFRFQLYHRKHHPDFELSESAIQQISSNGQLKQQQQQLNSGDGGGRVSPLRTLKSIPRNINDDHNYLSYRSPRNSVIPVTQTDDSIEKSRVINKSDLESPRSFPLKSTNTESEDLTHIPSSLYLPPIFTTEAQLGGIADRIYGKARMVSKGKLFSESSFNKDITKTQGEIFKITEDKRIVRKRQKNQEENSAETRTKAHETLQHQLNESEKLDKKNKGVVEGKGTGKQPSNQLNLISVNHVQVGELIRLNSNEITEAMNSIRIYFWGKSIRPSKYQTMSEESLVVEFLSICKNSTFLNLIQNKNPEFNLHEITKKILKNVFVSFQVFKEHYQVINQDPAKVNVVWNSLTNLNTKPDEPSENEKLMNWLQFKDFIGIAYTKTASIQKFASFLARYFNPEGDKILDQTYFLTTLKSLCEKVDKFVDPSSKKSIYTTFEQNFYLLGLLKHGRVAFSSISLRNVFLTQKGNHLELVDLILEKF